MNKNFKLKIAFVLCAFTGEAVQAQYPPNPDGSFRDFRGRFHPAPVRKPSPNYDSTTHSVHQNIDEYRFRKLKPEDYRLSLSKRPLANSKIVDFKQNPSEDLRRACMTTISYPVTPRPSNYLSSTTQTSLFYDINEYGFAVNVRIGLGSHSTDLIKMNSVRDVANSRFQPPTLNSEKLFCKNIRETFYWNFNSMFTKHDTVRTGPMGSVQYNY